jgi:regulatory protein YycI of two-component signal transduction system YycFG
MINFEGFYDSLNIMWKGMAGLFIVSISIMLIVMALKFVTRKKNTSAENSIEKENQV